jgi:basic amino acid/polyamine antiporter, APA family
MSTADAAFGATTSRAGEAQASPLRPAISRTMLTVFVIGDVLGAGIYALAGEVAGRVGGAIWTAFLAAGILAAFTATAYAELVTKYPQAAGAALYTNKAFKRPFFTFMVAFAVMCSGVTSAATLATAFGGDYLAEFVTLPNVLVGFVFIAVLALVNFRGIKESVTLNLGLTAIELTGLLLVVAIGAAFLLDGGGDPGRALEFKAGEAVPLAILSGASLAFFALIGFEDSVNVAEEVKEPSRVYPGALFVGLGIALTVYVLVTMVAGMAVPADDLAASDGPLLEVVQLGPLAMNTKVFSGIALFALTNGALINMIMASRLIYGMAQQGIVPHVMGRVHRGRRTPWVAIIFVACLAMLLIAIGSLSTLADTTVLLLLLVFVCVDVAVLVLRRDHVEHEHWRAPTALPVLGVVACLGLIVQKAVDDAVEFAYAGGLLLLGLVLCLISRALGGNAEPIDPAKLTD